MSMGGRRLPEIRLYKSEAMGSQRRPTVANGHPFFCSLRTKLGNQFFDALVERSDVGLFDAEVWCVVQRTWSRRISAPFFIITMLNTCGSSIVLGRYAITGARPARISSSPPLAHLSGKSLGHVEGPKAGDSLSHTNPPETCTLTGASRTCQGS
jgi:hypothetical protein